MGAPEIVDTSRLGPQEGFRIWARILARDLEPLAVRRDAERPFSVFMQRQAVGPIHLQRIRAEAHVAERTRATIRAADPGLFHLSGLALYGSDSASRGQPRQRLSGSQGVRRRASRNLR